jgi:flagella basal body P-ring formation protein FlgA
MNAFVRNSTMAVLLGSLAATSAAAEDAWVATHNLMPGDILRSDDISAQPIVQPAPDAVPATRELTGLEIKRRVYVGHPLGTRDIGAPTVVKANMPVDVHWQSGELTLVMRGNALEPGALGDQIRVLNPATSRTVRGTVTGEGIVEVRSEP